MNNKDLPAFPITLSGGEKFDGMNDRDGFSKRELGIFIIASGKVAQQPPGRYKQADAEAVALDAIMITDAIFAALRAEAENDLP